MQKIIDPHLHFFDLNKGDYHWLQPHNPPFWPDKNIIFNDFNESNIQLDSQFELAGYVHIEAGYDNNQGWREIERWESSATISMASMQVLNLAEHPDDFIDNITQGISRKSFRGGRHIIESPMAAKDSQNVIKNLKYLSKMKLLFELQIDLADQELCRWTLGILEQVGELQIVLNHLGFPPSAGTLPFKRWQANFKQLTQFKALAVKVSGFEMTNRAFSEDSIKQYCDYALSELSQEQVLFASNFPLVLFSYSYQDYWDMVFRALVSLGLDVNKLMYSNALERYSLTTLSPNK